MFRANRIGTPIIHTDTQIVKTTVSTLNVNSWNDPILKFNAVNGAANIGKFGETKFLQGNGLSLVAAANKGAICQQFTVEKPAAGDVNGVELNGSIMWLTYGPMLIKPFIAKATTPATTNMGAGQTTDLITFLEGQLDPVPNLTAGLWRSLSYRTQAILKSFAGVEGTYIHGFAYWNTDSTDMTPDGFQASFSLRQVNNSGELRYVDQLR